MTRKQEPVIESEAPAPAPSVGSLRSWKTGVLNPQNLPILILETNEGCTLTVAMPPQAAIDIGQSLINDGKTTGTVPAATN